MFGLLYLFSLTMPPRLNQVIMGVIYSPFKSVSMCVDVWCCVFPLSEGRTIPGRVRFRAICEVPEVIYLHCHGLGFFLLNLALFISL